MENILSKAFENIELTLSNTVRQNITSDQLIYHYTNCDALLSIINDYKFWFSSIEVMNDKEEVDYSISIFEKSLNVINIPDIKRDEYQNRFKTFKKLSAINTFALSLSLCNDLLILWNNYAKNDGYNLGLQLESLLTTLRNKNIEILGDNSCILVNGCILYNENDQINLFSKLLIEYHTLQTNKDLQALNSYDFDLSVEKIWKMIILYSSLIKSKLHEHENEYRIVLTVPDDSKL